MTLDIFVRYLMMPTLLVVASLGLVRELVKTYREWRRGEWS